VTAPAAGERRPCGVDREAALAALDILVEIASESRAYGQEARAGAAYLRAYLEQCPAGAHLCA